MFSVFHKWVSLKIHPDVHLSQVNFEDVQTILQNNSKNIMKSSIMIREEEQEPLCEPILITTIPISFTNGRGKMGEFPLIEGTLAPEREEAYINELLETLDAQILSELIIIIYGQNSMDKTVMEKAKQMMTLGFSSVCVYPGGMFEWCLLQDIYGKKEFPIEGGGGIIEPLLFKGKRLFTDF
jgi:hypothetical protein